MVDKVSSQGYIKHYSHIFVLSLMETKENLLQDNW
jgi:hypothetical protein